MIFQKNKKNLIFIFCIFTSYKMRKIIDPIKEGLTDSTGRILPKYLMGFDGSTIKTLNPPESLKMMKPEGCKGLNLDIK